MRRRQDAAKASAVPVAFSAHGGTLSAGRKVPHLPADVLVICARAVYSVGVSVSRECSRVACGRPAVATLTFVHAASRATLGPLTREADPHAYDLCAHHCEKLTLPRGWTIERRPLPGMEENKQGKPVRHLRLVPAPKDDEGNS
ncbi:DUF3499 family protein [Dermabacteraceae bacterium P13147]